MEKFTQNSIRGLAAAAGVITGLYGGWTTGSRVLVILMLLDYVLGCACALAGKSAKTASGHFLSQVAFMGILKKGVIMAVVLVAALLDRAVPTEGGALFRSAAEFFYIASEALSILENAGLIGVPVPRPLKQALEALREKSDNTNGSTPDD